MNRTKFFILPRSVWQGVVMTVCCLGLSGCGYFEFENLSNLTNLFGTQRFQSETADSIAFAAMDNFSRGKYRSALEQFEELKSRYPFGPQGILAELKAADCRFYLGEYSAAFELYKEFEERHPTNEAISYVLFQMAMSHYKQISTIDRDPGHAADSIEFFQRLLRSHPDSPYSEEAKARIKAAREFLANHEFYVASYYLNRESFDETSGRLSYLLRHYPETEIAGRARTLLAQIKAGNPPRKTWQSYIPTFSMPDWRDFFTLPVGRSGERSEESRATDKD